MSSIRTDRIALDTNVIIHAVRRSPEHPACISLVREMLRMLRVHLPLQVLIELNRNLDSSELNELFEILSRARAVVDYSPAEDDLVEQYRSRGAKKGDAVIGAHLHAANIRWLISENRHFLSEIEQLPFEVISAAEALVLIE